MYRPLLAQISYMVTAECTYASATRAGASLGSVYSDGWFAMESLSLSVEGLSARQCLFLERALDGEHGRGPQR